jgi:hypothetical protein
MLARMISRRLPALAALALGAALPASAHAAPDWLAPVPLGEGGSTARSRLIRAA